jgi:hypothetical protein
MRLEEPVDVEQLVDSLVNLDHPQLLGVLQRVFAVKRPYPDEIAWNDSRYFLGIGGRTMEDDPYHPGESNWGAWDVHAVGYIDREIYPEGFGETEFAQHGQCSECGTMVSSSVKTARCPICGSRVHGT